MTEYRYDIEPLGASHNAWAPAVGNAARDEHSHLRDALVAECRTDAERAEVNAFPATQVGILIPWEEGALRASTVLAGLTREADGGSLVAVELGRAMNRFERVHVLAHEMAHALERHYGTRLSRLEDERAAETWARLRCGRVREEQGGSGGLFTRCALCERDFDEVVSEAVAGRVY